MKTPHLLASLAVAVTAAAADLKDPTEVAREWNERTVQSSPPANSDLSLRGMTTPALVIRPLPVLQARSKRLSLVPSWSKPAPRERGLDAPNYHVPEILPDNMPPGSKLWRYGGQDYWLIPLVPSHEK